MLTSSLRSRLRNVVVSFPPTPSAIAQWSRFLERWASGGSHQTAAQKRLEELRALAELARRQAAARKANEKEGRRLQEQGTSRAPPIPPEEPAKDATGAQPAHGVPSSPPAAVPSQSRHTIERAGGDTQGGIRQGPEGREQSGGDKGSHNGSAPTLMTSASVGQPTGLMAERVHGRYQRHIRAPADRGRVEQAHARSAITLGERGMVGPKERAVLSPVGDATGALASEPSRRAGEGGAAHDLTSRGRRWRRRGSAEEHERGRGQSEQLVGAWVGGGRGDALPLSPEALAVFRRGAHGRVVEWLNERIRECRHGRAQKRELQAWVRFEGDFLRVFGESDWDVAAALAVVSGALTESRLLPRVAAMAAPTYLSSPGTVRPRGDLELFLRDSFRALTNVVGGLPGHPNALIQRRTAPAIPEVTFLDVWDTSHVACDAAARAAQQHFLSACRGFAEQRPGACHVEEFPGIPPRVVEWLLGPRAGRPHSARMAQWVADHVNATLLILPSLPPHQTLASAPDAPANLPVIGAPPRGPLTKAAGADGARSEHETPHDLAEPRLVSRIPHRGFYAEDLRALGPGTLLLAAESITEGLAASRVLRDVLRELMSPDKVLYLPRDSEVAQALGSCGPDVWSAVEAALQVRSPPGTLVRLYRSRGPRVNVRAQGASDGRKEQALAVAKDVLARGLPGLHLAIDEAAAAIEAERRERRRALRMYAADDRATRPVPSHPPSPAPSRRTVRRPVRRAARPGAPAAATTRDTKPAVLTLFSHLSPLRLPAAAVAWGLTPWVAAALKEGPAVEFLPTGKTRARVTHNGPLTSFHLRVPTRQVAAIRRRCEGALMALAFRRVVARLLRAPAPGAVLAAAPAVDSSGWEEAEDGGDAAADAEEGPPRDEDHDGDVRRLLRPLRFTWVWAPADERATAPWGLEPLTWGEVFPSAVRGERGEGSGRPGVGRGAGTASPVGRAAGIDWGRVGWPAGREDKGEWVYPDLSTGMTVAFPAVEHVGAEEVWCGSRPRLVGQKSMVGFVEPGSLPRGAEEVMRAVARGVPLGAVATVERVGEGEDAYGVAVRAVADDKRDEAAEAVREALRKGLGPPVASDYAVQHESL